MKTPVFVALACTLAAGTANAATPGESTLSCPDAETCLAAEVTWAGRFEPTLTPGSPEQCALVTAFTCDHFRLALALPEGYWVSNPGHLEVAIRWATDSTDKDLDLFVYRDGEEVARSAGQDSEAEVAFLEAPGNGIYDVFVVPVSLEETKPYEGRIEIEPAVAPEPLRPLLPNLVTRPPHTVRIASAEYLVDPVHDEVVSCYPEETLESEGHPVRCLRFDQIAANAGAGPLELRYVPALEPDLRQVIHWSDGTTSERTAETMELHPVHGHWHYKGFGLGILRNRDGQEVRRNGKTGFCLIEVDFEAWGQKGNSPRRFSYPGCQLPNEGSEVVQGIGPGWADVYNWFLADQYIDVTGVPDGIYRLDVIADPDDTLEESDETDNVGTTWICLEGTEVRKVGGPDAACAS